jgi:hypothetical protein
MIAPRTVAVATLSIVVCCCKGQTRGVVSQVAPPADESSNGVLQLVVEPELKTGQPIMGRFIIRLKNISDHNVVIWWAAPLVDFSFEVVDSSGAAVPPTERGKRLPASDEERKRYPFGGKSSDLAPGEEHVSKVDLTGIFQLRPEAGYSITVRRSRGLPKVDRDGKPLARTELKLSLQVAPAVVKQQ